MCQDLQQKMWENIFPRRRQPKMAICTEQERIYGQPVKFTKQNKMKTPIRRTKHKQKMKYSILQPYQTLRKAQFTQTYLENSLYDH